MFHSKNNDKFRTNRSIEYSKNNKKYLLSEKKTESTVNTGENKWANFYYEFDEFKFSNNKKRKPPKEFVNYNTCLLYLSPIICKKNKSPTEIVFPIKWWYSYGIDYETESYIYKIMNKQPSNKLNFITASIEKKGKVLNSTSF